MKWWIWRRMAVACLAKWFGHGPPKTLQEYPNPSKDIHKSVSTESLASPSPQSSCYLWCRSLIGG